jgi:hypothetical protein
MQAGFLLGGLKFTAFASGLSSQRYYVEPALKTGL